MRKFYTLFLLTILISGCYKAETTNQHNIGFSRAKSESSPIYLTFKNTRDSPFYFLLKRDSRDPDYKLIVHWISKYKDEPLFDGYKTRLKFLINNLDIMTITPVKKPKLSAYDIESRGHEEEALFSLSYDQFMSLVTAKSVTVELTGKHTTVVGTFNKRNTFRAFKEFAENSH